MKFPDKTVPRPVLEKLWDRHVIVREPDGEELLSVDLNIVHEAGSFLAFDQLRAEARGVRNPVQNIVVSDHYAPTSNRAAGATAIFNPEIRAAFERLGSGLAISGYSISG